MVRGEIDEPRVWTWEELTALPSERVELRQDDAPGFWEGYGYHNYGDPWQEQRYAGD